MRRRNFLYGSFSVLAAVIPARKLFARNASCTTGEDDEGPYFKAGAPVRKNIAIDFKGKKADSLKLRGQVFASCDETTLEQAEIDLWHASPAGKYDMDGYTCRGRQFSESNGSYEFETLMPARYPGRPLHLHMKVTMPGYKTLTTQIYFKSDQSRKRDYLFRRNKGEERAIVFDQGKGTFNIYLEKA